MILRFIASFSLLFASFCFSQTAYCGVLDDSNSGLVIHKVQLEGGSAGIMLGTPITILFPIPHDFLPGEVVDIHWGSAFSQRRMIVNNVTTNTMDFEFLSPFEGDTGIPELAAVLVSREVILSSVIDDPAACSLLFAGAGKRAVVVFRDDGDESLLVATMSPANPLLFWTKGLGPNPILGGGSLATVVVSNGSKSPVDLFIMIQYNSVVL